MSNHRFVVTGASGQLGGLVVDQLLGAVPATHVTGLVRGDAAKEKLVRRGVRAAVADYGSPATLDAALAGADRVLLVSSNALGARVEQHRNVVAAAKRAGVGLLIYTSVLHADTSPLGLAREHLETEALLKASGVPFVILRNGWYHENYTAGIPAALTHGAVLGSAGDGRIASAARADYAAAAVAVLTAAADWSGRIFELAGDAAYTLTEFAAEIARQSGKAIVYKNLPEADYKAALVGAGLPEPVADLLADSDVGASKGGLFDDGRALSALIGRPTMPIKASVAAALRHL